LSFWVHYFSEKVLRVSTNVNLFVEARPADYSQYVLGNLVRQHPLPGYKQNRHQREILQNRFSCRALNLSTISRIPAQRAGDRATGAAPGCKTLMDTGIFSFHRFS
jgi:hypothetical protein